MAGRFEAGSAGYRRAVSEDRTWQRGAGRPVAPLIDVTRPGPSERAWMAELRRRRVPRWLPPPLSRVVVVAAHPDDETLGAGGLVAMLHRWGWAVTVLALTDGEAAYDGGPQLAERRRLEQAAALARLAPPPAPAGPGGRADVVALIRLGLPDGRLGTVADLAGRIGDVLTPATWCLAPWPDDGHPDHEAAGCAAADAAAKVGAALAYLPIWAWHWQDPRQATFLQRASLVPLDEATRRRKRAALAEYRSQTRPLGGEPALPGHVLARFTRSFELLVR